MFHHCISFELFNLENRWRFGIYITRIKFLRKSRSGVKIPKQAGPKVSNEAEAYFKESTGYATCMCVTICLPIQTIFLPSNYILNSTFLLYRMNSRYICWEFIWYNWMLWFTIFPNIFDFEGLVGPTKSCHPYQKSYATHMRHRSCNSL